MYTEQYAKLQIMPCKQPIDVNFHVRNAYINNPY